MKALYEGLEAWRHTPFDWETANCCHYAKDLVERQGVPVALVVPSLQGPQDARQWLREQGHGSLYLLLVRLFGRPVRPLAARRGDVLYRNVPMEAGAVGIADRNGWFLSEKGLVEIPLQRCRWAFHIHE